MGKNLTLEAIYKLYVDDVYRYVYSLSKNKLLAEDIVQETFYRAYFYTEVLTDEKVKPWLFKVAYHTFIDEMRKAKKLTYSTEVELLKTARSAEADYEVKEQIEVWMKVLDTLPFIQKNIVILRDYYQFSYEEIAQTLGLTLSNVKVTLFRARKTIQKIMEKEDFK